MGAQLRRLRAVHDDEQGTSLAELIVGMGLMAVFMAIFTGAMLLMSNTVNKVEATTLSSGEVNNAFLQLDRSVRYADGISTIARSATSGDWNVEYETVTTSGAAQCVQLRLDGANFQQRTWTTSSATTYVAGSLTVWKTISKNVKNDGTSPFSVPTAAAAVSSPFQQLTVTLSASSDVNSSTSSGISMTFAALNSNADAGPANSAVCQQVSVDATS